jgi:hypothetical protein
MMVEKEPASKKASIHSPPARRRFRLADTLKNQGRPDARMAQSSSGLTELPKGVQNQFGLGARIPYGGKALKCVIE